MVNLEKYKNDGWGLSKKCFEDILTIVKSYDLKPINVLEFGSGVSTEFFVDLINEGHNLHIVSYDNDPMFATKIKHPNLKLIITNLVEAFDSDFENMFQVKEYKKSFFHKLISETHTRQKNVFYDIDETQLPEIVDIMIVDGPHGNGRNVAFLVGLNRLKSGSYVIIDDYNHYDFVERFQKLYPDSDLLFTSNTGQDNRWELGGIYAIYKIK